MAEDANPTFEPTPQQIAALRVLNELHRRGLSRLWIESVTLFTGGLHEGGSATKELRHHVVKVVIGEAQVNGDRMQAVLETAATLGCTVLLDEINVAGVTTSRLCLWPKEPASELLSDSDASKPSGSDGNLPAQAPKSGASAPDGGAGA